MRVYRFTSSALAELKQATRHYEKKENGLGGIFLDEINATVERILTNPSRLASTVSANQALPHSPLSFRSYLPDSSRGDSHRFRDGPTSRSDQLETLTITICCFG
jgi:hypothetical protein